MKKRKAKKIIFFVVVLLIIIFGVLFILNFKNIFKLSHKTTIRHAEVAGQFYPASQAALTNVVTTNLESAPAIKTEGPIKIIIVPHAGYDFSAGVAALAYKPLAQENIKRVYILGRAHHNYFSGLVADSHDFWETPLGRVAVDTEKIKELAAISPLIKIDSSLHQPEHSLEVQLPFLQTVLKTDFKIVPLLFGSSDDNDWQTMTKILAANLTSGDLIVVSSDMSHYPSYQTANQIDRQTLEYIENKDLKNLSAYAQYVLSAPDNEQTILCALEAVKTAMALAQQLNLSPQVLGYKNSGDTLLGDKKRVVGYGAVIFTARDLGELNLSDQKVLLDIARTSVESYVKNKKMPDFKIENERLNATQGAFVTLKKSEELRGCIGQVISTTPLWQVVRDMAIAAATKDDRFSPVTTNELNQLDYEISVLSVPQLITDWREIKLGQDGVIVSKGLKSGIFLPQVANESGWGLEKFLSELCVQKAGLAADCYKNDSQVLIKIFQAQVFK